MSDKPNYESPVCRHCGDRPGLDGHLNEDGFECAPCWFRRIGFNPDDELHSEDMREAIKRVITASRRVCRDYYRRGLGKTDYQRIRDENDAWAELNAALKSFK